MPRLSSSTRAAIRSFALLLANGTLEVNDLLRDIDYRDGLVQFGSELELVFAISTNVLEVGNDGTVADESAAGRRAAQWIRQYNDASYSVTAV